MNGVSLTIYDLGTKLVGADHAKNRSAEYTTQSLKAFIGRALVHCPYTDRAKEFTATALTLALPCDYSKSGRPQANGVVERQSQELKRGAKARHAQAGLPQRYLATRHHVVHTPPKHTDD